MNMLCEHYGESGLGEDIASVCFITIENETVMSITNCRRCSKIFDFVIRF